MLWKSPDLQAEEKAIDLVAQSVKSVRNRFGDRVAAYAIIQGLGYIRESLEGNSEEQNALEDRIRNTLIDHGWRSKVVNGFLSNPWERLPEGDENTHRAATMIVNMVHTCIILNAQMGNDVLIAHTASQLLNFLTELCGGPPDWKDVIDEIRQYSAHGPPKQVWFVPSHRN